MNRGGRERSLADRSQYGSIMHIETLNNLHGYIMRGRSPVRSLKLYLVPLHANREDEDSNYDLHQSESVSLSLVIVSDLHLVFHLALLGVATSDFIVDDNIKVSVISGVGSTVKGALNDIPFL